MKQEYQRLDWLVNLKVGTRNHQVCRINFVLSVSYYGAVESLKDLDINIFRFLNAGSGPAWFDDLMRLVSARLTWLVVAIPLLIYALVRKQPRFLRVCLLAFLVIGVSDIVAYQALKPFFGRERPCHQLHDVRLLQPSCGGDFGFPSNHAANAMAVAVVVALAVRKRWTAWLFPGVFLIGYSRIYLGAHFLGDVLFGYLVGAIIAICAYSIYARTPLFRGPQ